MKKIILIAASCFFALGFNAQTNTDEIALMQASYGLDKKQIITQFMKFTEAENAIFWKEYDAYESARREIGRKRISNITEYANNYDKLTDAKVTELINMSFEIRNDFTKLLKSTNAKMSKVMSPIRVAQWVQVEYYLQTVVDMEIFGNIPLIGEIEKTKK